MARRRKIQKHPNDQYYVRVMRGGVSKTFWLGKNSKKAQKKRDQIERDIQSGKIQFGEIETTVTSTAAHHQAAVDALEARVMKEIGSVAASSCYPSSSSPHGNHGTRALDSQPPQFRAPYHDPDP